MEDTTSQVSQEEPIRIRKANDYIAELKGAKPPEMLFDEFWRTGELAMLYGSSGSGKSILAVQIAEAIARGQAIDGFRMPDRGCRVLYVDMEMSDAQFVYRNSISGNGRTHKFSGNFYRDAPPDVEKLSAWLEKVVEDKGVRVVVIDSLAAVRKTQDGVRESLSLMRELRKLKEELGISILVVTDCAETRRGKTLVEADMGRNRILCTVADSVFAICRHRTHIDHRFIVQTRSRNAPVAWTSENAPLCSIVKQDTGLLAFQFDDLFVANLGAEDLELIRNLKIARDEGGETWRSSGELFGISHNRARRLYYKWSPAVEAKYRASIAEALKSEPPASAGGQSAERKVPAAEPDSYGSIDERSESGPTNWPPAHVGGSDTEDPDEFEEAGIERPPWLEFEANGEMRIENGEFETAEKTREAREKPIINSQLSTINSPKRRSVFEFPRGTDGYGREIYIEKAYNDGRPWIWYYFDRKGELIKKTNGFCGNDVKRLGRGPYLE